MTRHYCTYFDHRYLPRGLAMIRSLRRYEPDATVWVLCLSSTAYDILTRKSEPGVRAVALNAFEADDAPLAVAKHDGRTQIEYYFTCTPSFIRYVLRAAPEAKYITYLDSDLWFFSDPEPIYREAKDASIIIVPHRFPPRLRHLEMYGVFNVGWLSFQQNGESQACLEWWRARCLEWCHDRVDEENQRFADQRYLDKFSGMFPGTHIVENKGANLAPWNVSDHDLVPKGNKVLIDGTDTLIFFHFHGLKKLNRYTFLTGLEAYGVTLKRILREKIYLPYLGALLQAEKEIDVYMPEVPKALRDLVGSGNDTFVERIKNRVRTLRALTTGGYVRLPRNLDRSVGS